MSKKGAPKLEPPQKSTPVLAGDDCTYMVICVTERGASTKKWAGFQRISPAPNGPANFTRITLSFYSAADAADALTKHLRKLEK